MAKQQGIVKTVGKQAGKVAGGLVDVAGEAVSTVAGAAGSIVDKGRGMVPGMNPKPARRRSTTTKTAGKPKATARTTAAKGGKAKPATKKESDASSGTKGRRRADPS